MKYPIRYFSIGLFTASLILLLGYQFFQPEETLSESDSIEDIIENIENEGYRVISETEYISLATAKDELNNLQKDEEKGPDKKTDKKKDENKSKDQADKESSDKKDEKKKQDKDQDKEKKDSKKKDKEKDKSVKTYTLTVEENMVFGHISERLEKNKIIKDAAKFNKFMEDNNYSPYLQIGEFELNSDMTYEEIAKKLTNR